MLWHLKHNTWCSRKRRISCRQQRQCLQCIGPACLKQSINMSDISLTIFWSSKSKERAHYDNICKAGVKQEMSLPVWWSQDNFWHWTQHRMQSLLWRLVFMPVNSDCVQILQADHKWWFLLQGAMILFPTVHKSHQVALILSWIAEILREEKGIIGFHKRVWN